MRLFPSLSIHLLTLGLAVLATLPAADVTLQVGDSQAFSATVLDQFGDPLLSQPTVSWSATGGTVSPSSGANTTYTAGTTPGTSWQIAANAAGLSATRSIAITAPATLRDPENPTGTSAGLFYEQYHTAALSVLPDFSTLTPVTTGVAAQPDPSYRTRDSDFALRFTGYIAIPADGDWTLFTTSDDGSKLYIGNTEVVANDGLHGSQERNGTIGLKAGKHAVTVEFFERSGGEVLQVRWQGPGTAKALVPAAAWFHVDGTPPPNTPPSVSIAPVAAITLPTDTVSLDGTASDADGDSLSYAWTVQSGPGAVAFGNAAALDTTATFTVAGSYVLRLTVDDGTDSSSATVSVTVDPAQGGLRDPENPAGTSAGLSYAQYHTAPLSVLPDFSTLTPVTTGIASQPDVSYRTRDSDFALRFTGYIDIPADGDWTLFTTSDDGSKLYIGNTEVVANDGLHGSQERNGTIGLKAGKHAVTVEFFERSGGEVLQVRWQGPGTAKALVPAAAWFHVGGTPPPNTPPSVSIASVAAITLPADTVSLDGTASDADGDSLSYAWTVQSGPGAVAFGNAAALDTTATFTVAGSYVLRLTVDDGSDTTSATVTVTVNPAAGDGAFLEDAGLVVMEAEHAHRRSAGSAGDTWQDATSRSGFAGDGYLAALPNDGTNVGDSTNGALLEYDVDFATAGTWYLWVRMLGANGNDDSVHAGLGSPATYGQYGLSDSSNSWVWVGSVTSRVTVTVPSAGVHTVRVWQREDGTLLDRVLLSTSSSFTPSGNGPVESARSGITPPGGLPAPWSAADIGNVAAAGTVDHASGTFTIEGSGADIWGSADEFHFVNQSITGDVTVTARVASIENTNSWAKAGVMIRDSADPKSVHAMCIQTASNGMAFQRRTAYGSSSATTTQAGLAAPGWVRISRSGDLFTASISEDGVGWTDIGSATIVMGADVLVGLAVTSHNDGTLCTAVIDEVTVSPMAGG